LNLKKIIQNVNIWSWLSSSSKSADVYQISPKSDDFSLKYSDFTFSRWRMSAILNFRGPIMGSFEKPMYIFCWSSIETIAHYCLVFLENRERQTDKQMGQTDGQRQLRKAAYAIASCGLIMNRPHSGKQKHIHRV